jgi:chitodextrinase
MRPSLPIAAAALLAAVVAAPVAAVAPGGASDETVTGVLEAVQVDDPGSVGDRYEYTIRKGHQLTRVTFAAGNPRKVAGDVVSVKGKRGADGTLHARSARPGQDLRVRKTIDPVAGGAWAAETDGTELRGGATTADGDAQAIATKSIAVVLFNFSDLRTTPYTKSQIQGVLLNNTSSVKSFYEEESKGRLSVTGTVFGWYQIAASTANCDWSTWHTQAWNAAVAAGANLSSYSNVMFVFPNTSACGWAGLGYVPGPYTYINGTLSVPVMTHELGHNFGLAHANAAHCVVSGTTVMIAATSACSTVGYADPFSTMGNNALRHNHASQLGELGWLSSSEKVVATPGNTYTLTPYFDGNGLKLVRVPRGDGSFFDLDVRMTYGVFDTFAAGSAVTTGVTMRLGYGTASPTSSPQGTMLLDSTPGTSDLKDAPLLVGKTMTDPVSKIQITTMSSSAAGVVVRVRETVAPGAITSPAASPADTSVALSWGAATDNVAIAGYRISRGGTVLATTGPNASSYTDSTVAPGTAYSYTIEALDTSSNVGPPTTLAVTTLGEAPVPTPTPDPTPNPDPGGAGGGGDTVAPTAPTYVAAVPTTTTVSLSWPAATDDTGVVSYRITRNGSLVKTTTDLAWKDTARKPLTKYTYTVAALDGVGNVSTSASVAVKTLADTQAPTRPANFHKVRRSGGYVVFDWSPSVDNVGVTKYFVYRVGRARHVAVTTVSRIRIWTARGARYYVRALDQAGNRSAGSATARGRR